MTQPVTCVIEMRTSDEISRMLGSCPGQDTGSGYPLMHVLSCIFLTGKLHQSQTKMKAQGLPSTGSLLESTPRDMEPLLK